MKKIVSFVLCIVLAYMPLMSYAFKLETHVWVGQQVINDLEDVDGKLSFNLGDQSVYLNIPSDVRSAILNNKAAFLMGNIGPDAVPDVVVGQTVVHPGVEDKNYLNIGWRTNKWLEYLLNVSKNDPLAKSFAYGYLGHAAADVMAHTYVNQYSGGIFRLLDGETLVEQRHIALESYIAKYTPPLTDRSGLVNNSWRDIISKPAFTDFVRKNLVYDSTIQSEYKKVPTAAHLVAYTEFRNGIDSLAEKGIWRDIDIAVAQIVAAYFGVTLSSEEAGAIVDKMQPVMNTVNGRIPDAIQDANRQFYTEVERFDKRVFKNLSTANEQMKAAEQKLLDKHQSYRQKFFSIESEKRKKIGCPKKYLDPIGYAACKKINEDLDSLIDSLNSSLNRLENELFSLNDNLRTSTVKAQNELSKAVVSAQKIQDSLIDFIQVFGGNVSPIQSYLRFWRGDVDAAMSAYVTAASQMMLNTMKPAIRFGTDGKAEDPFTPIETWFDCYHMQIIGIPNPISGCEFKTNVQALRDSIDKVLLLAEQATSVGSSIGIPGSAELRKLQDETIGKLEQKLKDKVTDKIKSMIPEEIQQILLVLKAEASDQLLNQYFNTAESERAVKGIVMIPDMSDRVKAEMHLTSQNTFDPNQYAVAYNAVVLAKLALLDKVNFDQLAQAAGSNDYGNYFYSGDNLVAQAFASIDGNHQWMPLPPPYPNTFNQYGPVKYTYSAEVCTYALSGCTPGMGFVPWKGDMRDKLFRKLFKGPLSPGIDSPQSINKSVIVGQAYTYQACAARPFPSDISDRTCLVVWLIPVLSGLLLH
jgi:hypothetical protein